VGRKDGGEDFMGGKVGGIMEGGWRRGRMARWVRVGGGRRKGGEVERQIEGSRGGPSGKGSKICIKRPMERKVGGSGGW